MPDFYQGSGETDAFDKPKTKTVNIAKMENAELEIKGRHDVCIVPRAVPVVAAMMAITLCDFALQAGINTGGNQMSLEEMRNKIDTVDEKIVKLIAQRIKQSQAIGDEKKRAGNRLKILTVRKRCLRISKP